MPDMPREFEPVLEQFQKDQALFLESAEGQNTLKTLSGSAALVRDGLALGRASVEPLPDPAITLQWFARMPAELVQHKAAPLIDFQAMDDKQAWQAMGSSLLTLALGLQALLVAGERDDPAALAVLQVAFGADPAATALREALGKPFEPPLVELPGADKLPGLEQLAEIILYGTLREVALAFATCGATAQAEAAWVDSVQPLGRISRIKAGRYCAGEAMAIDYAGFGTSLPPDLGDVVLALPRRGGCTHHSLRQLAPQLFAPGGWRDSGRLEVTLPKDIYTGCVGFFALPRPIEAAGCEGGSLIKTGGMLQSVLGELFGRAGVLVGQSVVDVATRAEAGRHRALPCATCQPGDTAHIHAGPPVIDLFDVVEAGPIHPRGYVTLRWSVDNADAVEIVPRAVADSLNPHELPAVPGPLPVQGRQRVDVRCTRLWEGDYVLRARNANGCTVAPVERAVRLRSGCSPYRVGVYKLDITDRRPDMPMLGFSDEAQKSCGEVDLPLYARAFVIEQNQPAQGQRVALVVCDLWGMSQRLKGAVLDKLNRRVGRPGYSGRSLVIGATHTHAGTGGYFEYYLYNMTGGGYDAELFEHLAERIALAVHLAEQTLMPGRVYVNRGPVPNCGANRSLEAYLRNPEAAPHDPSQWTDQEMLLLRVDGLLHERQKGQQPLGAINWHALHPTSLGMYNDRISGDSKGWAADMLEREMAGGKGRPGFVAAFANAAAGDVSGNVELDAQGNKRVFMPVARYDRTKPDGGPYWQGDHLRMEALAQRQYEVALQLCEQAAEEVLGDIAVQHTNVDMSQEPIQGQPGARTWPAAMGVSFGAGSTEDSVARTSLDGAMLASHIVEGYTEQDRRLAIAALLPHLVPAALGAAGAVAPALIGGLVAGVPVVLAMPGSTAAAVVSGTAVAGAPIAAAVAGAAVPGALLLMVTQRELTDLLDLALNMLPPKVASALTSTIAMAMFPTRIQPAYTGGRVTYTPQGEVDKTQRWNWELAWPSAQMIAGHGAKPIMFAPGLSTLVSDLPVNGNNFRVDFPLVPHVIPLQLMRIGQVALACVPAEFTGAAGRRLKSTVSQALMPRVSKVAVFGYANAYSGYVTTPEEYDAQHYEGASTLYGPHTLAAYQQRFVQLATAMRNGTQAPTLQPIPVPAITPRNAG